MPHLNPTGVVASNSLDYINTAFSLLNSGACVVNLRSESDSDRIERLSITEIIQPEQISGWYSGEAYLPREEDQNTAQVLFTSGTEGNPKGIYISHKALSNTTQRLISVMEIDNTIREYVGVPVNYSFGFGRCRVVSQAGGKFFIPSNGFNPMEIAEMLGAGEINAISAVPTLWRLLLANSEEFSQIGGHLKWIEIGSQYMSRDEKEALKSLFPNAKIIQHYGLTEASRTSFLKIHETTGQHLESVGSCLPGTSVRISNEGRIQIQGAHVGSKILTTKLGELCDKEGWFTTSDLGEIVDGYLYYKGRADDQINCGGIKLSPDHIQEQLNRALSTESDIAITAIPSPLRGQQILCAILDTSKLNEQDVSAALNQLLPNYGLEGKGNYSLWRCSSFPQTATGKLQRKELTKLYQQTNPAVKTAPINESVSDDSDIKSQLIHLWKDTLGLPHVPTDCSFYEVGGDSLSSITVSLKMQKLGLPKQVCKMVFEGASINEIAQQQEATEEKSLPVNNTASIAFSLNFTRGILALLVVAAHWMPGVIERLPSFASSINIYLSPLYSAGTPGFAVVFGMGIGFFYIARYQQSASSLTTLVKRNAAIIGSGIIVLACLRILIHPAQGLELQAMNFTNSLYGVLLYYFFAVISIPLWIQLFRIFKHAALAILLLATLFYGIHQLIDALNVPTANNPILQFFVLLINAKYNYFEMSAGVFVGVIFGNWLRLNTKSNKTKNHFLLGGVSLILLSIITSNEMHHLDLWFVWPKPLYIWTWMFYSGVVLLIMSLILRVNAFEARRHNVPLKLVSCVGVLAFPIFITHELVIPLKEVLTGIGIPMALLISMSLFITFLVLSIRKIYRTYY